jgi:carboxypeptidase Taq
MTLSAEEKYQQLCQHVRTTALLTSIDSLLGWDERTQLPPAGGEYRAEQMTCLAGLIHDRHTDPQVGQWLMELIDSPLATDPESDTAVTLRELKRDYDKQTRLPKSLVEELARAAVEGQQLWDEARKKDSFATFQPVLERMVELKRQQADALGYSETRYDALLDDHEPGELTSNVTRVLGGLREELVPLVQAIADCPRRPDVSLLKRRYPVPAQEKLGRAAAAAIGFDFSRGRLDVTSHPFCTDVGPHDCRITTRYDEHYFPTAFFGILHETGHGLYDQGLPVEHYGLPLGHFVSMGIHESQSRMWENLVGRSRPFWEYLYPQLQQAFPEALADVALADFHFAINDVRPSLIRVEADEVTYNLHIIIRFELEQALIGGDLAVADLPGAWKEKYRQYLGIEPPNDADGVLQDIHWSAGLFGYFPTYSLGNLYAAQLFAQAEADLGGLNQQFARGEFQPLLDWLREKIHRQGQRYTAARLVERVTGKPLGHADLINYLLAKMEPLYSGAPVEATAPAAEPSSAAGAGACPVTMSAVAAMAAAGDAQSNGEGSVQVAEPPEDKASPAQDEDDALGTAAATEHAESASVAATATEEEAPAEKESVAAGWSLPDAAGGTDHAFDASTLRTSPRQQPYEIGMVGNLIGVVVFGFVGLAIGYWLLNFFGGERFNFLEIWLPFVSRG